MSNERASITLYRTAICARCAKAASILREILEENGLDFQSLVVEKFVDKDQDAAEELRDINIMSAPTIRIGERTLTEDGPLSEDSVRAFLSDAGLIKMVKTEGFV